jgi:hypothetical protein
MKTSAKSLNWLESSITVFVPSLALAAYLTHRGFELGGLRSLLAAGFLGLVGAVVHFGVARLLKRTSLRDEVALKTCLHLVLSLGLAVAVGRLFVG